MEREMKWQPIETAPKDGTAILALVDGLHENTGEPFIAAVAWYREGFWLVNEEGGDTYQPTHWMPLPPPPNTQST
jgi:Protein of unknown function (DUF551)